MQARCPHCKNVFATDRAGVQFCPHCGREIEVPATAGAEAGTGAGGSAAPPEGPSGAVPPMGGPPGATPPPPGSAGVTAWERRSELGAAKALWLTWKDAMLRPTAFWAGVRPDGSPVDALLYAWIVYAISAVLSIPLSLATTNTAMWERWAQQAGAQQSPLTPYLEQLAHRSTAAVLLPVAIGVVLFPLLVVIGAAILHLFALLFGTAKNGYWATFRVVCYALSPSVFDFYGCLFPFVFIYVLALTVFGLGAVQETTQGKAAATVLTPFGLSVCCCCLIPVFALGAGGFAAFSHAHP